MNAASSALSPSGIAAVDRTWGGLRPGASVLLVGRATAGRTALALQSVRAAVAAGQTALLLSPRSPADLNLAAQSSGFDLGALHASGRLRVLRIPSAKDLAMKGNDGLQAAYRDLAGLASQAGAHRIVIEDLTPLVQFSTFEAFGAAFDSLRQSLSDAALVVGLGEPANAPSRQLIGVVQERVGGTVRVAGTDIQFEVTASPEPEPAPASPDIPAPPMAPPTRAETPAEPEPARAEMTPPPASAPAIPEAAAEREPAPNELAPARTPSSAPAIPEPAVASVPAPEESRSFEPPVPTSPAFDSDSFSSDGASVSVDAPEPAGHDLDFAPVMPTPPTLVSEAAFSQAAVSDFPRAGVEPALPPDPELAAPSSDPFGRDPGKAFFENGYLVDSRGATATPITAAHPTPTPAPAPAAPTEYSPPPSPMPPPGMAPTPSSLAVPSFTSLTSPSNGDPSAAQAALQAAFNARAQGTPFLVIAARMDPSQPEATSFSAVVEGLRKATPAGSAFYADVTHLRSLLILPGATAEAASGIFAALQQHLQSAIGPQAEGTLRAVAAITVPDGQPFGTAQQLWEYAVSG